MNHSANPQSVGHQTPVGAAPYRAVNLKLEDATQDDLDEKKVLKEWEKNRQEKEEQQKRETGKKELERKPGPKS